MHREIESEKYNRELWENPEILTLSIRRHTEYDPKGGDGADSRPLGSISPKGKEMAKEAAKEWKERLPKGAHVDMWESPSVFFAGLRDTKDGGKKPLLPARSRQTASLYEKEVFGKLAPAKKTEMGPQSVRRKRADLMGDFTETATDLDKIPAFFKAKAAAYRGDNERFARDYARNELPEEVHKALKDFGGSDSVDHTQHVIEFLESFIQQNDDRDEKTIGLVISHSDLLESFSYFVERFVAEQQGEPSGEVEPTSFELNEGIDIHIDSENNIVVELQGREIRFNIDEFKQFISEQK